MVRLHACGDIRRAAAPDGATSRNLRRAFYDRAVSELRGREHEVATLVHLASIAARGSGRVAVVEGDAENGLMATGLVAGRLGSLPTCAELLSDIETQARAHIAALTGEG